MKGEKGSEGAKGAKGFLHYVLGSLPPLLVVRGSEGQRG